MFVYILTGWLITGAVRINAMDALFNRLADVHQESLCRGIDAKGNTLLHYCVYYNRRKMVEVVIRVAGEARQKNF